MSSRKGHAWALIEQPGREYMVFIEANLYYACRMLFPYLSTLVLALALGFEYRNVFGLKDMQRLESLEIFTQVMCCCAGAG